MEHGSAASVVMFMLPQYQEMATVGSVKVVTSYFVQIL
jgi:hypothetical protein